MDTEMLRATIAYFADRLEEIDHADAWIARAVLDSTGGYLPTQEGVDALLELTDARVEFDRCVRADLALL